VPLAWATRPLCGRGLSLGGPRSVVSGPVSALGWADRLRSTRPFGLPGTTDRAIRWAKALGWSFFSNFDFCLNILEIIQTSKICRNLYKIHKRQIKFPYNLF
jgi:hypothetical protein